jgi:uncharacterized protein
MRREQRAIDVPAKILVTGDTHITSGRASLPESLVEMAEACDLTIHTGDLCVPDVVTRFGACGPLIAVCGNNETAELGSSLPDVVELKFGDHRGIVTHGHLERGGGASTAVRRAYAGRADLVIYGHSHMPEWEEDNDTWFLNPGSPTQRRRAPTKSFAVLDIDQNGRYSVAYYDIDGDQAIPRF